MILDALDDAEAGPAILRLRLLETTYALRRPSLTDEARAAARLAVDDLRRAIAERPGLSFADLAAKLKTEREAAAQAA